MLEQNVNIKKLRDDAKIPTYGTEHAAGCDLYACIDEPVTIKAGETVLIKTGLAMEVPVGYAGLIYARSGLATKKGLAPANKVGVVDADYRGEIMVALHNHSNEEKIVDCETIITKDMAIDNEILVIRRGKKKYFLGIIK